MPPDVSGTIEIDGPPVTVETVAPMQRCNLRFSGTVGETLGIAITDVELNGATETVELSLTNPDGPPAGFAVLFGASGRNVALPTLTQDGPYIVTIDPLGEGVAAMTLTLSRPVLAQLDLDGLPTQIEISRPGQSARMTFSAPAGLGVSLFFSAAIVPVDGLLRATVMTAEGTFVAQRQIISGERTLEIDALPASAGSFTVLVDPIQAVTTNLSVRLSTLTTPQ